MTIILMDDQTACDEVDKSALRCGPNSGERKPILCYN